MLALAVLLCASCDKAKDKPTYKIGYMNCNSTEETMHRFLPITRYLSDKVGVNFVAVPVDAHDFETRFKAGEFAITHTNSLLYVIFRERYGINIIATDKRGQYGTRTAGSLIVRKGSEIKTVSDLKGKRLAFGPMLAPTGYMAEYDLMLNGGINPESDLAHYTIPTGSFKHEKVIYGVLFGQYDVAAAPVLDLEIMTKEGKISPDDFTVIAQSSLIPYCTFASAKDTDPELVKKVRDALMALKPSDTVEVDGERVKVMKSSWIDGFEILPDSDYDGIRTMAKRVNMPPYQKF